GRGIGVLYDLARVAAVRLELGLRGSIACAISAVRLAPLGVLSAWVLRAGLGLFALSAALFVWTHLGVDGVERRFALVVSALVHQGAVLLSVFLRASWFAHAIGRVAAVQAKREAEEAAKAAETPEEDVAALPVAGDDLAALTPALAIQVGFG